MAAKRTRATAEKTTARKTRAKATRKTTANAQKVANPKLNSQKKGSLIQTSILILTCITVVILLALISYNPDDPGLFHYDSNAVITNKAGSLGAYFASVLFGFFGYVAYLIPVSILVSVFLLFRSTKEQGGGINTGITVFGVFLALISGCGLATLLWPESVLIYKAGGLLGLWVAKTFVHMLGDLGATLLLFSTFIAGFTLFADIRWLKLIDKIGDGIMGVIELMTGSGGSPAVATAGADSVQLSFPPEVTEERTQQTSTASSGSMLGALGAGVAGLFAAREVASHNEPSMEYAGNSSSSGHHNSIQEPTFGFKDSIVPLPTSKKSKREPVLGFPEHLAADSQSTEMKSLTDPDLGLEIITKNYLDDGYETSTGASDNNSQNAEAYNAPSMTVQGARDQAAEIIPAVKRKFFHNKGTSTGTNKKTAQAGTNSAAKSSGRNSVSVSLDKAISLPPISLLNPPPTNQGRHSKEELEIHARNIVVTLEHYGVRGVEIDSYFPGPIITRFELLLPPGTKVSKITGLAQDMARSMCVPSIRIVEVIPGKTTIGVEVPNESRDLVAISEIINSKEFRDPVSPLTMVLGKTIAGRPATADMGRMPHLLIAGTTGSGKSVGVNAMLISLLYKATPEEVRLILIDPKMLELSIYEGIPHLLTPVVTDMKDASNSLRWAVGEMERRYALMSHLKVRSIKGYNKKVKEAIDRGEPIMDPTFDPTQHIDVIPNILEPLPYIVIVIDEFADMMMVVGKKVEELIARLAQKARASGIHLILATQRPSVDVITGLIKANIPSRIAFQVSTKIDSRTILDQGGAEALLGHGDMLYLPPGTGLPQRVHGAFVDDQEVEDVVSHWKLQGEPEYIEDVIDDTGSGDAIPGLEPLADSETDALYDQAVAIVTESRRASISYVQRRLKVGYNRAASMIEDMEQAGVVSAVQSNGTREVLASAPPPQL